MFALEIRPSLYQIIIHVHVCLLLSRLLLFILFKLSILNEIIRKLEFNWFQSLLL